MLVSYDLDIYLQVSASSLLHHQALALIFSKTYLDFQLKINYQIIIDSNYGHKIIN